MTSPKAKSKFEGIFNKQPEPETIEDDAAAPERVEKAPEPPVAPPAPLAPRPPSPVPSGPTVVPVLSPGPALPTGMNFKLSPRHAEALRQMQFRTGKTKQRILEETLDLWIDKHMDIQM